MKILLVAANTFRIPYPVYPLGLDHVAGAVEEKHEVQILDLGQAEGPGALRTALLEGNPDVVGLSLRNVDNTDAVESVDFLSDYEELARIVRQNSRALLVLGGPAFTLFPRPLMQRLSADYGLVGEGERLSDLLSDLEQGQPPKPFPGLFIGEKSTQPPEPLDRPFGRRALLPADRLQFYLKNGGMLNLQTKRGCPYRCIYCTYPCIEGHVQRVLPPDEVARTARALEEAGASYLFITDSAFNSHTEHSLAVAQALRSSGLRIPWGAFFVPSVMPEGYYSELRACGLTHVEFGTESLSGPVLRALRKPFTAAEALRGHEQAVAAGLFVAHYFLLGGPGEDRSTLETTLKHADELERAALFFFCGLRIYPGTELHRRAVTQGQMSPTHDLLAPVFYQPQGISLQALHEQVTEAARGRFAWIIGSGGETSVKLLTRMYARGYSGPLWEKLIRGG